MVDTSSTKQQGSTDVPGLRPVQPSPQVVHLRSFRNPTAVTLPRTNVSIRADGSAATEIKPGNVVTSVGRNVVIEYRPYTTFKRGFSAEVKFVPLETRQQ
ncbi:hypothetical protein MRX96_051980 [Rhipicephalus microplus]